MKHGEIEVFERAVHQLCYVSASDPGAVGANKFWVVESGVPPYAIKIRDASNAGWEDVGSAASTFVTVADVTGNKPAAGTAGRIFLTTDGMMLEVDDGSDWLPYGPLWRWTPPDDGDFSWVNQGTGTVTPEYGIIRLTDSGNNTAWRLRVMTAPSTPYTVTAGFLFAGIQFPKGSSNARNLCLGVRDSDGRLRVVRVRDHWETEMRHVEARACDYTAASSFTETQLGDAGTWIGVGLVWWLRVEDDGTDLTLSASLDKIRWFTLVSSTRTDFAGAGSDFSPDEVVFGVMTRHADAVVQARLVSWEET